MDPPTRQDLQRVNVVGVSGSGKSTFARRLAELLAAPYLQMDQIYWGPEWTEPETDAFRGRIAEAVQPDQWVLDGNYHNKTHDLKWTRATCVIWLDMPFPVTLRRAIGRALHRSWTQHELWPGTGNRESFRRSFLSHDSVVLWTITSFRPLRRRYEQCQRENSDSNLRFLRLRTPRQAESLLEHIAGM